MSLRLLLAARRPLLLAVSIVSPRRVRISASSTPPDTVQMAPKRKATAAAGKAKKPKAEPAPPADVPHGAVVIEHCKS